MNWKKLLMAFVGVYIVNQILTILVHAVWLGPTYGALAEVWRPEAELTAKSWIMFVTSAFFCFFFCYIYARGVEGKGIGEGVRYGAIIGLFVGVQQAYDWYAILPIPYSLAFKWFVSGMAVTIILGIVVAMIYKE